MKKFASLLWGFVLIIIGIVIALNSLGIMHINLFFDGWWTLFIIIPSLIKWIKGPSRMASFIGLVIGIVLLLCAQSILTVSMVRKLIIPFILIMIGLSLVVKELFYGRMNEKIKNLNKLGAKEYGATFGESKVDMSNEIFDGADLTAVFGSVELNLINSEIKEEQIIKATAIFGGITIKVPENINVKVKSTSLFGGVNNKVKNTKVENLSTIYVNSLCMFGGVTIK